MEKHQIACVHVYYNLNAQKNIKYKNINGNCHSVEL